MQSKKEKDGRKRIAQLPPFQSNTFISKKDNDLLQFCFYKTTREKPELQSHKHVVNGQCVLPVQANDPQET